MNKYDSSLGLNVFEDFVFNYGIFGDESPEWDTFTDNQKKLIAVIYREAMDTEEEYGDAEDEEYCQQTYRSIDKYFESFVNDEEF